jgi:hypothetical protein
MERFDVHVVLEVCEIIIESATHAPWNQVKVRFGKPPKVRAGLA